MIQQQLYPKSILVREGGKTFLKGKQVKKRVAVLEDGSILEYDSDDLEQYAEEKETVTEPADNTNKEVESPEAAQGAMLSLSETQCSPLKAEGAEAVGAASASATLPNTNMKMSARERAERWSDMGYV